jgi:hypothetical protein
MEEYISEQAVMNIIFVTKVNDDKGRRMREWANNK